MARDSEEEQTALLKMSGAARPSEPTPVPPTPGTSDTTPLTGATSKTSTTASSLEALERDELVRTRLFSALVIALALAAAACVLVIPGGDPFAQKVTLAMIALGITSMLFMLYQTQDPVRYRQPRTALGWFVPAICVNAAVYFFGVFSPAPMAAVLGLYFLGLGKSGGIALAAYVICAAAHAVMAGVVMASGRDVGIVNPELTLVQQVVVQLLVQLVMMLTIITARMSRRSALLAVGELEQAVRLAAHRQALLLEAREELDRAMRADRGRFSEQVIGAYELGNILGRGAMGEVYAAVDNRSRTEVAVKLLTQASLGNPNHVMRFMRELRTAASVESPHVVRVLEVGEQPLPFLVMERLAGATLSDILRERRTLPPAEVVALIEQVGIGITAAATAGIVHRDLKPQNVFFDRGTWKVLDFGVARAADDGGTLTAGQIVGTPSYMAPEQARGGAVDHRTDLYALAAVAYRAFTGHPPFASKDVAETLYRVVHTRPTRPSLLAPSLHPDVDLVLAIGLAPSPKDRWASAAELAGALRDATAGGLSPALRARGKALAASWSGARARRPSA